MEIETTVADIVLINRRRNSAIRAQRSLTLQMGSMLNSRIGWKPDLPKKEKDRVNKLRNDILATFSSIFRAEQKGKTSRKKITAAVAPYMDEYQKLVPFMLARWPLDEERETAERLMVEKAESLPVFPFIQNTPGMASMGLGVLVGEIGNLSKYKTPARVWKRMGVAVINGERQGWKLTGDAEKAAEHGYNRKRRSALWTIGDSMLKHQVEVREKNTENEHRVPLGKYGDIYLTEKERQQTLYPELPKIAWHRRAQRKAEKEMLKDLWLEWKRVVK